MESPPPRLRGAAGALATTIAAGLSLYALYWVVAVVQPQGYRLRFLLGCLILTFILYPLRRDTGRARVPAVDWVLAAAAVAAVVWPLFDFDQFIYRAAEPTIVDLVLGSALIVLVLEATRRTSGPVLTFTALGFLAYAWVGPFLDLVGLSVVAHRGYGLDRIVGTLYMTLEGIFGVPLDVASTYIILFTVFGAILEHSGAARFLLDWSRAALGRSQSGSAAGRAVTLAGGLLGMVSGSGVATTVMLGSVSWPMLQRAGYPRDTAGAVLSAAGIGAILAPPTMGAAAFVIAEFLKISYLQVLLMAVIPALLYYLSIFLMIEADSRRLGTRPAAVEIAPLFEVTRRGGYHFLPLISIGVLLAAGVSTFRAVFWATLLAVGLSFVRRDTALWPRRLLAALDAGGRGVLSVAATTATAGIIVGVVTLTGLGLKVAGLIVALAGGHLFLTVLYAALAVWLLGLAVPVTASYIIAAVMVAPAMTSVGVAPVAAHMFIFYYAVLSEVSPPTALAPFAAAALTGGNPFKTMMLTWKYTVPAFLVPFVFTLDPRGMGVLLRGTPADVAWAASTAALGVVALAAGFGGWMRRAATLPERALAVAGGVLLFYPAGAADAAGVAIASSAVILHAWRLRGMR
ncbi:MAG: TRAP transporter fused permease subunit [Vicinamibacterales bacterium]